MIDVSSYQGVINWHKVFDDGVRTAYVKLTEGTSIVDARAKGNVAGARAAGIAVGLYHYAHPSRSPIEQVKIFLERAHGLIRVDDPAPALDLEIAEGHSYAYLSDWKAQFLAFLDHSIGHPRGAVFYSYYYFWKQMKLYPDRPVWGAALGSSFRPPPSWHAWQYSFAGHIDGIEHAVDLSKIVKPLPRVVTLG